MNLPWTRQQPSDETSANGGLRRSAGVVWFVVSWAATLAVVAVMLAVIAFVTIPRALGWHGVIVLSGSMEPALETGSIAFVDPATPEQVKVGDILTFRREGTQRTLITHRVVGVERTDRGLEFTTKGDANSSNDNATVKEAQVVGRVTFDVSQAGYAVDALHDRTTYYIFIGIPAALLILNELISIGAELRKARRKGRGEDTSAPMEGAWS